MSSSGSYQSFTEIGDDGNHVMVHILPSEAKSGPRSWQQYIHDLDDFLHKVYNYHQKSGFLCLILSQVLELIQIIFIIMFTIFLFHCIDYDILFKNKPPNRPDFGQNNNTKVVITDSLLPLSQIELQPLEIFLLIFAIVFWLLKFFRCIRSIYINLAIKSFYNEALHVNDVNAFTWQDIQTRLIHVQHLCLIQEGQLNELVVYNRILRHHNFMIALVNKELLPIHFTVPLLGEVTYLTKGLQYNLQLLLFKGPFSLFEHNWKLRDEIKSVHQRQACADLFAKYCIILAFLNILLFPLIILWQFLYSFYIYAEAIKRDPSMALGTRSWSLFGRWYCRHFNELDHQLNDRLNRGYKAATKYMNSFTSPLLEIIAKHVAFIAGSILAVFICLTIYDEDVITIEHLITLMTALGGVIALSRAFISSEIPSRYTHSELNARVLEHIHYKPHGYAPYSSQARSAMANVFQYKIVGILEELLSPLATPYILIRHLRPKSTKIIEFFHNHTMEVAGTGDVCTFAMMNIKEHGNPLWKCTSTDKSVKPGPDSYSSEKAILTISDPQVPLLSPDHLVTEHGKLELSLVHFKLANPKWNPYSESQRQFIHNVTSNCAIKEEQEININEKSSPSTSSHSKSSTTPLPSTSRSLNSDQEIERNTYNRERDRILNDMGNCLSECEERAAAMSLSTLFIHQYVSHQSSTSDSRTNTTSTLQMTPRNEKPTESEPLLRTKS